MRAGFSYIDISPESPQGLYLAGFQNERMSTGLRDPLLARVACLESRDLTLVLVSLDLVGLMRPEVERIRAALPEDIRANVIMCSTHTHAGPDTMGLWGKAMAGAVPVRSGVDPAYLDLLGQRVAKAIITAREQMDEVNLFYHQAQIPYPDVIENIREPGNFDKTLRMIKFTLPGERAPFALLINFPCHPEILWEHNTRVSADFVGEFCARLSEETGAFCMFFNGALGGMVTADLSMDATLKRREEYLPHFVQQMRNAAWRALNAPGEPLSGELGIISQKMVIPVENLRFKLMARLKVLNRNFRGSEVETEVNLLNIGGLPLVTLPGEALPAVGYEAVARVGDPRTMVLCLGCDELGYLLPEGHFHLPAYKYETSMSVGRHAVPRLMQAVTDMVKHLCLKDS